MSVQPLKINSIKSKGDLHAFYDLQMTIKGVTVEIQEILKKNRNLPPGMNEQAKILKPKEVLLFIIDNGYPNGFFPDDEMKMKIDELKEEQRNDKRFVWGTNQANTNV